jgi:hypothetical protein
LENAPRRRIHPSVTRRHRYDFSLDRAGCPDTLAAMRMGRTNSHLAAQRKNSKSHHPKNPGVNE